MNEIGHRNPQSPLAAISTIYGAIVTIRQTDMKRLIAFSSVSHMGYVLLGISVFSYNIGNGVVIAGMSGAALQMFTHGTITGLAFLVIGLIYDRTHTRYIPHLGGLWKKTPIISVFFLLAGFASLGLPSGPCFIVKPDVRPIPCVFARPPSLNIFLLSAMLIT